MKKYILIAGVNGAGKSTLYQTLHSLHEMIRINTDEIVRKLGDWRSIKNQIEAGKIAVSKLKECFKNELTFNQETTLCGKSVIGNIVKAKEKGYRNRRLRKDIVNPCKICKRFFHCVIWRCCMIIRKVSDDSLFTEEEKRLGFLIMFRYGI